LVFLIVLKLKVVVFVVLFVDVAQQPSKLWDTNSGLSVCLVHFGCAFLPLRVYFLLVKSVVCVSVSFWIVVAVLFAVCRLR